MWLHQWPGQFIVQCIRPLVFPQYSRRPLQQWQIFLSASTLCTEQCPNTFHLNKPCKICDMDIHICPISIQQSQWTNVTHWCWTLHDWSTKWIGKGDIMSRWGPIFMYIYLDKNMSWRNCGCKWEGLYWRNCGCKWEGLYWYKCHPGAPPSLETQVLKWCQCNWLSQSTSSTLSWDNPSSWVTHCELCGTHPTAAIMSPSLAAVSTARERRPFACSIAVYSFCFTQTLLQLLKRITVRVLSTTGTGTSTRLLQVPRINSKSLFHSWIVHR